MFIPWFNFNVNTSSSFDHVQPKFTIKAFVRWCIINWFNTLGKTVEYVGSMTWRRWWLVLYTQWLPSKWGVRTLRVLRWLLLLLLSLLERRVYNAFLNFRCIHIHKLLIKLRIICTYFSIVNSLLHYLFEHFKMKIFY